jgi:hypothetical protein
MKMDLRPILIDLLDFTAANARQPVTPRAAEAARGISGCSSMDASRGYP